MTYQTMELFLHDYAPDADTGWEWLRHLHERQWALVSHGSADVAFRRVGMDRMLLPYPRAGAVRWYYIAGEIGATKRAELSPLLTKREAFPDPIAAATFAEVQMSDPLVHEDLDIPGGAPQAPSPAYPPMPMPIHVAPQWGQAPPPPGTRSTNYQCLLCRAIYPPWAASMKCPKCGGNLA